MVADWVCRICGGTADGHSAAGSACIWDPILRPVMDADVIVSSAMAIHVDTEGMDFETIQSIEDAIYWALDQAGVIPVG